MDVWQPSAKRLKPLRPLSEDEGTEEVIGQHLAAALGVRLYTALKADGVRDSATDPRGRTRQGADEKKIIQPAGVLAAGMDEAPSETGTFEISKALLDGHARAVNANDSIGRQL